MEGLKAFLITIAVFLVLDWLWLGVLMPKFYLHELGDLARKSNGSLNPRWGAAALVYLLLALGIVLYVIPYTENSSLIDTFYQGAILGLVIYGVYDLTNHATLANYGLKLTLVDILGGMFATGTASVAVSRILFLIRGWSS